MTQRESRLSRKIQDALRAEDGFVFKVHGSEYMMAGLPDLIVCVDGYFLALEVKHPESRENLSPRQKRVHDLIRRSGGEVFVVCSVAEALEKFRLIRQMHRDAKD